jgi:hypothetical protein
MNHSRSFSLFLILALMASCNAGQNSSQAQQPPATYEQFKATVYVEPGTGLYIVDGDTPLETDEQLRTFFEEHVAPTAPAETAGAERAGTRRLTVNRVNNRDDRWADPHDLTYCVSTGFGPNHDAVVQAMQMAVNAWSRTWDVGFVNFRYRGDQDGICDAANGDVVFDVSPTAGQSFLARSFFPSFARSNRSILIDSSSFGNIAPFTLQGVLRHELGHTLGFRHEHTRPEAGTCFEDSSWRPLTPYDSASVMHYPQCNGTNRGDLVITHRDREGHLSLYGSAADDVLDAVFYLSTYTDLQSAFGPNNFATARDHWNATGRHEGRRSAPWFDVQYYLGNYPDLQQAFGPENWSAAVDHWVTSGLSEGRASSVGFDVGYYLAIYPDLQAAFGSDHRAALEHFVTYGLWEGRRSAPGFDVAFYLASYPDLQAAFGPGNYRAAFYHWVNTGFYEGRRGAP